MKKICLLLILAMLFSMTACRKVRPQQTTEPSTAPTMAATEGTEEPTVPETTVPETTAPPVFVLYLPESMSLCGPDGSALITMNYVYEEGWMDKETFTSTVAAELPGQGSVEMVTTFGDKYASSDMMGLTQTETHYDEQGRAILQVSIPNQNPTVDKIETVNTYDEYGRMLTTESKTYSTGQADPIMDSAAYTYTDTDTGSKGTSEKHGILQELYYDRDYHLVASVTIVNGQETSRMENTYDEYGNQIRQVQYIQGQKSMENLYTYTAVEVDAETAARLPQFCKGK